MVWVQKLCTFDKTITILFACEEVCTVHCMLVAVLDKSCYTLEPTKPIEANFSV